MNVRRPAILAHRGGAGEAAENTLAAIAHAVAAGADGVELDVRLAAGGLPVLCHDADLLRIARLERQVAELTASDLAALDLGALVVAGGAAPRLPTLAAALAALPPLAWLDLELKPDGAPPGGAAEAVAAELARARELPATTIVTSFDADLLAAFARLCPALPSGLVLESPPDDRGWTRHRAVVLELGLARAGWAAEARRRGLAVLVWPVETADELAELAALGIDAAITDHPVRLRAAAKG